MPAIIKNAGALVSWLAAGVLFQVAEPSVPIMWAMLGALIFGLALAIISIVSPVVANRSLAAAQNEIRVTNRTQLDYLNSKINRIEEQNELLFNENLRLREANNKMELDLELAYNHIQEIEREQQKNTGTDSGG